MTTRNMTAKAQAALKTEAKRRIKRVGTAAKQLEDDLKWIANNKAWAILGYEDFPSMFEGENGYPMGPVVRNIVAYALIDEGMRTRSKRSAGHTTAEVADMLGLATFPQTRGGGRMSPSVQMLKAQRAEGVPAAEATTDSKTWAQRKRGQNRQIGIGPDEPAPVNFQMPRRVRDWYRNEAKTAVTPVPDAELYRQVLIAHMDKVEAGRKASRRTTRSRGKAA